jgi:hypothetical protein
MMPLVAKLNEIHRKADESVFYVLFVLQVVFLEEIMDGTHHTVKSHHKMALIVNPKKKEF